MEDKYLELAKKFNLIDKFQCCCEEEKVCSEGFREREKLHEEIKHKDDVIVELSQTIAELKWQLKLSSESCDVMRDDCSSAYDRVWKLEDEVRTLKQIIDKLTENSESVDDK